MACHDFDPTSTTTRGHVAACPVWFSNHEQRQDLTRIANIDGADVRGFAPRAATPPMAAYGLLSLFNDLGTQELPEAVEQRSRLVALPRSGISEAIRLIRPIPTHPKHPSS